MAVPQRGRWVWRAAGWGMALVLLLVAVLLVRTLLLDGATPAVDWALDLPVDGAAAAERLAGALRFETVSHEDRSPIDPEPFRALHAYLETSFPALHEELERELVGGLSLLYRWPGRLRELPPVLLMAHQDVVPVEAESATAWEFSPFAGQVIDGFVQGRGALDDKAGLVGLLEAVEILLRQGFWPQRTIYLAFGHDEEIGGWHGAGRIAELLRSRGVSLAAVLDEGGMIAEGMLPGLSTPVALIGIAEKGAADYELTVRVPGGHSSVQQAESAIGILSRAIARIEDRPLAARLEMPTREMFRRVAPRMPFLQRLVGANLWLLEPLVATIMADGPTGATVRTIITPTVIRAGIKPNVLPTEARAILNVRILTGDTVEGVLEHLHSVIDDGRVEIRLSGRWVEPSPVSRIDTVVYELLETSILEAAHLQGLVVAPFLMIGGTDAKHFVELSDRIYRFLGARISPENLHRVHGVNERISVEDYSRVVRIYCRLLHNLDRWRD